MPILHLTSGMFLKDMGLCSFCWTWRQGYGNAWRRCHYAIKVRKCKVKKNLKFSIWINYLIASWPMTRLLKPMVLEAGQHFTIRDHGGTIGTGKLGIFDSFSKLTQKYLQGKSPTLRRTWRRRRRCWCRWTRTRERSIWPRRPPQLREWACLDSSGISDNPEQDTIFPAIWMHCFYMAHPPNSTVLLSVQFECGGLT